MGLDAGPQRDPRLNGASLLGLVLVLPGLCVVGQDQWALALPVIGIALGIIGLRSEWRTLAMTAIAVNGFLVVLQAMVLLMGGGDRIPPFF